MNAKRKIKESKKVFSLVMEKQQTSQHENYGNRLRERV